MGRRILLLGVLAMVALAHPALAGGGAQGRQTMQYRLEVRIEPGSHRLEAEAWIQHPPSPRFYLHQGLIVRQITADGREVSFLREGPSGQLPYVSAGTEVIAEAPDCQELYVKYAGEIPDIIFGCNLITPDLIELSFYAGWYPAWTGLRDFDFALQVDLPSGYVTVTNGRPKRSSQRAGRTLSRWESYAPGFDMVLLASPKLHTLAGVAGDTRVEVYHTSLPESFVQSRVTHLVKALERLTALYGSPRVKGVLYLVYSPREGQGYMRLPLVVISEHRGQTDLGGEFGEARRFRDECHEIAHFWWALADSSTPNDWINEGLAEYSAFRLSEEQYGPAFKELRLREYQQHADSTQTTDAIAETQGSSPDREVNRYDKATLMLLDMQSRFGVESLDRVLRSLYCRFAGTHRCCTADFLSEVKVHIGAEAESAFREALYRKGRPATPTQ